MAGRFLFKAALLGAGFYGFRRWVRSSRYFDLSNRVVLITGGSRGLGLVMAREFAAEGARLAICSRDPDELNRAQADLEERGASVLTVECDVTSRDEVESMVSRVASSLGPVEVLVNNAGVIQVGPLEEMTVGDFEEAMNSHFWSTLYTSLAVWPQMRARGEGRIVNISSIGGKVAVPHLAPYCASKFAQTGLSEALRAELARDGILVTTVIPGMMRTGSHRNAEFKGRHRKEYSWFAVSNAVPVFSISAENAARRIVEACRYGDSEIILSIPSDVGARLHGVFPGLTAEALGLVNRLLPAPGGIGPAKARGAESESAFAPSPLTVLSDRAAEKNNEMAVPHPERQA